MRGKVLREPAGPRRLFTARRYASAVYAVVVCLSVCYARYCIKTAEPRITQTTPHDSYMIQGFCGQKSPQNSNAITPSGALSAGGVGKKSATFDKYM